MGKKIQTIQEKDNHDLADEVHTGSLEAEETGLAPEGPRILYEAARRDGMGTRHTLTHTAHNRQGKLGASLAVCWRAEVESIIIDGYYHVRFGSAIGTHEDSVKRARV